MNTLELAKGNRVALKHDAKPYYSINKLLALPKYYGFVDTPHNFVMFLGGNDDGVALRFFYKQPFERMTLPLWIKLCKGAKNVIDVGAHTGSFSLATAMNCDADVFAFEPFLPNFSRLILNLRANKISKTLAIPCAASHVEGYYSFTIKSSMWYLSSGGHLGEGENNVPVRTVTLDNYEWKKGHYLRDRTIDLIKIDTEGHEPFVIKGAEKIITRDKPTLMIECNNDPSIAPQENFLKSLGYTFYAVDDQALNLVEVDTLIGRGSEFQRNFFAVVREDHHAILKAAL